MTLGKEEFALFKTFIYDTAGITLSDQKIYLVQARLAKRVRELGFSDFRSYYDHLVADTSGTEILFLISLISTNVTSFFRESRQWDFLKANLDRVTGSAHDRTLRIWSAACSSGEEPYSLALFFDSELKQQQYRDWKVKILATDISKKVLSKAIAGHYPEAAYKTIPQPYRHGMFDVRKETHGKTYTVKPHLKEQILFRMFNLVYGDYSLFKRPFDIIFCRNVMIYFDTPTKEKLIQEFYRLLKPGGYLFVGHSESLVFSKEKFKLIGSSIYQKEL